MRVVAMVILHHLLSSLMLKVDISCKSLTSLPKPFVYTKTGNLVRAVCVLCYNYWLTSLSFMCTAIGIMLFCYLNSDSAAYSLEITVSAHHFRMFYSSVFLQLHFPLSSFLQFPCHALPWHIYLFLHLSISSSFLSSFYCSMPAQKDESVNQTSAFPVPTPSFLFFGSAIRPALLHATCPWYPQIPPLYIISSSSSFPPSSFFFFSFSFPPHHHLILFLSYCHYNKRVFIFISRSPHYS